MAQGSPHSVSANVGFVSDYAYRGISQTNENMAIQGRLRLRPRQRPVCRRLGFEHRLARQGRRRS